MKKFEELEQQETTSQGTETKTSEKISISPKVFAILGGVLLLVFVGVVFLFKGTEKNQQGVILHQAIRIRL